MYRNGNTSDIIRVVLYADSQSSQFVLPGADRLRGKTDYDTLRNIFNFVQKPLNFKADGNSKQVIQAPSHLFEARTGDCKSYSVAVGALCRHFGIPYRYRFTSADAGAYTHVFVVATVDDNGTPEDVYMDTIDEGPGNYCGRFDVEPPYYKKSDRYPQDAAALAGVGAVLTDWIPVLGMLLLLWLILFNPFSVEDVKRTARSAGRAVKKHFKK